MSASVEPVPSDPAAATRAYDSTLRRQRSAETRERIVVAGTELLRASSIRDWRRLTVRAAAERAGVNERTVYRYFGNEKGLRDAVMHRLEEEAGIDLEGMQLEDIADVAAQIFEHVSAYPAAPRPTLDPTLTDANRRQKEALLGAVGAHQEDWSDEDRQAAAALFDVLWSVETYDRLVTDWQLGLDQSVRGVAWVIDLMETAIREGRGPSGGGRSPAAPRAPAAPRIA
jgi:AcrR family transcriptional regulator